MQDSNFYFGNPASPSTAEEQQAMVHLKLMMQQFSTALPQLPPQYDAMVGNALLNLALMRLIDTHGQHATANLLAGAAEMLWNDGLRELNFQHN